MLMSTNVVSIVYILAPRSFLYEHPNNCLEYSSVPTRHLFEYLIVHNYTLFVARVALCNDIHTQARNSYLVRRSAYQLMRQQVKSNLLLSSKIIVTRVKLTNRQTIWKIVKLKLNLTSFCQ